MVSHARNTTISSIYKQDNPADKNTISILENYRWLSNMSGMETFNERLKRLAKQKGLTQEALAEAMGLSQGAVSKWYREGKPSDENMAQLASLLNTSAAYLEYGFGGTDAAAELLRYLDGLPEEQVRSLTNIAKQLHNAYTLKKIDK